jgi:hypothetical protein
MPRRSSSDLIVHQPRQSAPAPDPRLNSQVAEAERVGIATVARLQAGAFATSVAIQNATMLSQAANEAFKISPMGEHVYQAIFAAYGSLAVAEIQALGLQNRGL